MLNASSSLKLAFFFTDDRVMPQAILTCASTGLFLNQLHGDSKVPELTIYRQYSTIENCIKSISIQKGDKESSFQSLQEETQSLSIHFFQNYQLRHI